MAGATSRGSFDLASVATLPRPSLRIGQWWGVLPSAFAQDWAGKGVGWRVFITPCSQPPTCRPERSARDPKGRKREPKDPGNISRATTASGNSLECFFPVRVRSSLKFPASAWRGRHRGDFSAAPSTALGISPAGSNARRTAQLRLTPQSLRSLGLRSGLGSGGVCPRPPTCRPEARIEYR